MSEQPEPDSGYALDSAGRLWTRRTRVTWALADSTGATAGLTWPTVCETYGPMTPLLPAVRPDGAPDDAVPFVGWVARDSDDSAGATFVGAEIWSPTGIPIWEASPEHAERVGLPVPAAPAPSLPERLRERIHLLRAQSAPWDLATAAVDADLLEEALDALESGSQP